MADRAWTVISLGDDRQYAGNTGYEDEPTRLYRYDSAVNNHKQLSVGDLVFIRNRQTLIGTGRISAIDQSNGTKTRQRCPECRATDLKRRARRLPEWRCGKGHEFATPISESIPVTVFEAHYGDTFVRADGTVTASELRGIALRPNDQLSIEEVDPGRFTTPLQTTAPRIFAEIVRFIEGRALPPRAAVEGGGHEPPGYEPSIGDARAEVLRTIRERRGQKRFRDALIRRYGPACLVSGCAVLDVVEAAHVFPFRGKADHHPDNGLLLRADLHTLFDLNLLAIHPVTLTTHLHRRVVGGYPEIDGNRIRIGDDKGPAREPLVARWETFERSRGGTEADIGYQVRSR